MDQFDAHLLGLLSTDNLRKIGCSTSDSYLCHLRDLYHCLEEWGLTGHRHADIPVWELVQYHGFDHCDLPDSLKSDVQFIDLHNAERRLFKAHERLIMELEGDPDLKPFQGELDQAPSIALFILLADSISILCQTGAEARDPDRLRSIARIFLEIYQSKALEYGIFFDTSQASDKAFEYLNPCMHQRLMEKIVQLEPLGHSLCVELTKGLQDSKIIDRSFGETTVEFRLRSISAIARGLGVLFDDIPELVTISKLCDIGRIRVDCRETKHLFQVLQFVMDKFPAREVRLGDNLKQPKRSGYRALHLRAEIWLDYGGGQSILSTEDRVGAECERLSFTLLLPEGSRVLDGDDRLLRNVPEPSTSANSIKVKTPEGAIKALPARASVADFAFAIHSDIGIRCKGADLTPAGGERRPVGPEHLLNDGDEVEVKVADDPDFPGPTANWLDFCVTRGARSKIVQHIRAEKQMRRFNHIVKVTLLAMDGKGLTASVAEAISKRNIYAFRFEGSVLSDGRAQFIIQLLMTKDQKIYNIDKKYLIRSLEALPHCLSVRYHVSNLSDFGVELTSLGLDGKYDNTMRDAAYFVGRRMDAGKLEAWYGTDEVVFFLCGFYRAGKTLLVSHFISELTDVHKIYVGFNNCPENDNDFLFAWLIHELRKQCLSVLKFAPEPHYGDDTEDLVNLCDYLVRIVKQADCKGKKVIFVFDDIDAIELKTSGSQQYLFHLFRQLKAMKDNSIASTSDIKIIAIGQYILYRNLRDSPIEDLHHGKLHLKRFLARQECIEYVSKRFRHLSGNKIELNYLNNPERWREVVDKIGYNPNNLSIAVNRIFYNIQSCYDGKTSHVEVFKTLLDDVYRELLSSYSSQAFGQLRSHYLDHDKNPQVYKVVRFLANTLASRGREGECQIAKSAALISLGSEVWVTSALTELCDFGFINVKEIGGEVYYNIPKNITWDYLILHFTEIGHYE